MMIRSFDSFRKLGFGFLLLLFSLISLASSGETIKADGGGTKTQPRRLTVRDFERDWKELELMARGDPSEVKEEVTSELSKRQDDDDDDRSRRSVFPVGDDCARTRKPNRCDQPKVRVNWFSLTNQQRRSWQRAFMNLSRKPGCYWNVYNTRLDDFVLAHITQGKRIHFTSSFLPWHALFVDLFYDEMAKAGYDGPAVYYDWTHDADRGSLADSAIFNQFNFGGDGQGGPIPDGPFVDLTINYLQSSHPSTRPILATHKVTRQFNDNAYSTQGFEVGDMYSTYMTSNIMDEILTIGSYHDMRSNIENVPHAGFHDCIGGEMWPYTSASDPLFWLHHVNVDRLWRSWQILWDPNYNRYEGNTIQFADQQDGGQEASLQDILNTAGMERNLTVSEVINPRGGYLCYEYDFYYSYGTESRPEDQIVRPPASSR